MNQKYDPERHRRRSIRLKKYDYSRQGAYFLTICTHNKTCLLGDVVNGEMRLNEYGVIIRNEWLKTAKLRPNVRLDEYIIMPNHLHGIIIIEGNSRRGTMHRAPTFEQFGRPVVNSLPTIIRSFKSTTTRQINQIRNSPSIPFWQRNYYEHVIRHEDELNQIREYIMDNSSQWQFDRENPSHIQ